eukprot:759138-Hanusia_phi.AAC.1
MWIITVEEREFRWVGRRVGRNSESKDESDGAISQFGRIDGRGQEVRTCSGKQCQCRVIVVNSSNFERRTRKLFSPCSKRLCQGGDKDDADAAVVRESRRARSASDYSEPHKVRARWGGRGC